MHALLNDIQKATIQYYKVDCVQVQHLSSRQSLVSAGPYDIPQLFVFNYSLI